MFHFSKHSELVDNHLLISFDILLEDNLDRDLLPVRPFSFPDNAIGSCAKCFAKFIFRSAVISSSWTRVMLRDILLIVGVRLAVQLIEHVRDW
jgi:hypothetical protein